MNKESNEFEYASPLALKTSKTSIFLAVLWFYSILCDDTPDMTGSDRTWTNEPSRTHENNAFEDEITTKINQRTNSKTTTFHENYQEMAEKWPDVKISLHFKKFPDRIWKKINRDFFKTFHKLALACHKAGFTIEGQNIFRCRKTETCSTYFRWDDQNVFSH